MKKKAQTSEPLDYELAVPRPHAMIESLRSVGYTLHTAIADIVDNSIAASAKSVWVDFHWAGKGSTVGITDDGVGMTENVLTEAMRPGTQSPLAERSSRDLGRFGLGLKTASFSQCRSLTVTTKKTNRPHAVRRWDLDYVEQENEWRLLKAPAVEAESASAKLSFLNSGTVVVWSKVDRLVDDRPASDSLAHEHFLNLIGRVREHLAMTFHRFLSGVADGYSRPLRIYINGSTDENLIRPWDPFLRLHLATQPSPVETVGVGRSAIRVQPFVLPHKDRLSDAEFDQGGGPLGWSAQQGFYIYRNDRILLAGDWLGLGRNRAWQKEEHCRLARLSIDLANTHDFDWSLDVKKSSARPPAMFRERLTGIGETARKRSKDIFFHRGQVGPRPTGDTAPPLQRPWRSVRRRGSNTYAINREHPLVAGVLRRLGPLSEDVEALLRVLEETVPVERIWLDVAEEPGGYAVPYQDLDSSLVWRDLKKTFDILKMGGYSSSTAMQFLERTEPFNRYPELIVRLKEA